MNTKVNSIQRERVTASDYMKTKKKKKRGGVEAVI